MGLRMRPLGEGRIADDTKPRDWFDQVVNLECGCGVKLPQNSLVLCLHGLGMAENEPHFYINAR